MKLVSIHHRYKVGELDAPTKTRIQEIFNCSPDTAFEIFHEMDKDLLKRISDITYYNMIGVELKLFPLVRFYYEIPEHSTKLFQELDLSHIRSLENPL